VGDLVDQVVSLRPHHDQLVQLVDVLDDEQLVALSGASGWRICDVLSHLGSGSEIMLRSWGGGSSCRHGGPRGRQPGALGPLERDDASRTGRGVRPRSRRLVETLEYLTPEQPPVRC
jgi:hypothetical protein